MPALANATKVCVFPSAGKFYVDSLLFMNLYPTDGMIKTLTGADPKTFRKWVWKFMNAMSDMTPEVFQLARRFENRKGMCTQYQ